MGLWISSIYLSTSTVKRNRDPTSCGFVYVISRAKSFLVAMDLA